MSSRSVRSLTTERRVYFIVQRTRLDRCLSCQSCLHLVVIPEHPSHLQHPRRRFRRGRVPGRFRCPVAVYQGAGGILRQTTYIAVLSGGSWLVGSPADAGFPSITDMLNAWIFEMNRYAPIDWRSLNMALADGLLSVGRPVSYCGFYRILRRPSRKSRSEGRARV